MRGEGARAVNARLEALPLVAARQAREQVELQIEKEKLSQRRAQIVKRDDILADGRQLHSEFSVHLGALEKELLATLIPGMDETAVYVVIRDAVYRALAQVASAVAAVPGEHRKAAADGLRPQRHLTVSQWADARRILKTGTANPGPWRTDFVPYMREIMDCLSVDSPIEECDLMKSAQVAGTEGGLNWIGYVMDHAPAEMLMVMPSLDLRKRFHVRRFNRLLQETDCLRDQFGGDPKRSAGNAEDLTMFPGGSLIKAGANSPNSLRSDAVKYVLCDEVDGFEWEVGKEGDPLTLIENRQRTYGRRRKLFLISTPTVKGESRIEERYEKSDKRRYHISCPHCGELQALQFKNLKWKTQPLPEGSAERKRVIKAWYVCEHTGCIIEEYDKPQFLAEVGYGGNARWVAEHPERDPRVRGYHISALYSPIGMGDRWPVIAQKWLDAQDDVAKLKAFINTYLGEPWEDLSRKKVEAKGLRERAEPYRLRIVPPGCLRITAGVDTQDDRLPVKLYGWGRRRQWWVLDYVELRGDPGRDAVWNDLASLLNAPLVNAYGRELRIEAAAVDTGGHYTEDVKAFSQRGRSGEIVSDDGSPLIIPRCLVMAIKGSAHRLSGVLPRRPQKKEFNHRGKPIRSGAEVWEVGTEHAKDRLYRDLTADTDLDPALRRGHFSVDLSDDYFDGLTAEYFDPVKNRYVKKKGKRNEPVDTWVYAYAAGHHPNLRIDRMTDAEWDRLARLLEPAGQSSDPAADRAPRPVQDPEPAAPPVAAPPRPTPRREGGGDAWM